MAAIEIIKASKTYGAITAVDAIDLHVDDGEFVVLLGPSGCGKSTLLRMVAGLEGISSGEIRFDGQAIDSVPTQKRNVAMVFQNYALYPHLSVAENLSFGLRIRGVLPDLVGRKTAEASQILGISQFLERKPRQLSGGQRQRVAMGRSIVREPVVFLFDEPLSNLDAKLRGQMRVEIRQLQRMLGTTALYVTHDQVEAMTLADRVVVLNKGRIEQVAAPLDLYARPETLFVADFVGTNPMNFLDAFAVDGGFLLPDGLTLPIASGVAPGREVRLGIRPEHLKLDPEGESRVLVRFVEPLGSDTLIHGALHGQSVVIRADPQHGAKVGETIPVSVRSERLHVFDRATERRVN